MSVSRLTRIFADYFAMSAYKLTERAVVKLKRLYADYYGDRKRKPGKRELLPTSALAPIPCMVVERLPPLLDGRHFLRCKEIIGPGLYYEPESRDIIVYAGITTWLVVGDEIMAVPIRQRAQGSDPYPTRYYALMNPPTDQATLDEPEADCIVDSPVPCIAEPPDADPCLPLGEP